MSTGEDIPEGHSIRARMMIVELSPGDVTATKLTAAQAARPSYSIAMADWIQWLAQSNAKDMLTGMANDVRDRHIGVGHSRTPPIVGDLLATAALMCQWCRDRRYFPDETMTDVYNKAEEAILMAANEQHEYLQSADPVTALCETLRHLLNSGTAHVRTRNGGVPRDAADYGWTEQQGLNEVVTYKANGPKLGWIDRDANELLLDPNVLPVLKKHSGGKLAMTSQTLLKRLKDANLLTRTDAARGRNTIRMQLEGHTHNVLCLCLSEVMDDEQDVVP